MHFRSTFTALLLSSFLLLQHQPACHAQDAYEDAGMIPSSAIAAVFASPKAILADPAMELIPHEFISAGSIQEFGVDACEIRSVALFLDNIDFEDGDGPKFAVILRFDQPQTIKPDVLARMEKNELDGKPIFDGQPFDPSVYLPDSKTIVIGSKPFIQKMLRAKGAKSGLIDLVQNSKGEADHINAFLAVEPIRALLDVVLPAEEEIPFPFKSFRSLPDNIESATMRLSFSNDPTSYLKLIANDEGDARKVGATVEQGLTMGRGLLLSQVMQELQDQPAMLKAIEAYDTRVGDKIVGMIKPEREGRTLTFDLAQNRELASVGTMGILIGMLLPAVQQVRAAARRTVSSNNLRQVGLSMHNYEGAYMHFPGNICDKDGKPLLSWRVAILPFMEEQALYEQFHLDEPWDSEHNIKLLDQLPLVYESPSHALGTRTLVQGFAGPGTIFEPGEKIDFAGISDGTSNTILCIESDPEEAVEWSKPADIPFNPKGRVTQVGRAHAGGCNAVFCDCSTRFISNTIDSTILNHLIQRNDGNIVDW